MRELKGRGRGPRRRMKFSMRFVLMVLAVAVIAAFAACAEGDVEVAPTVAPTATAEPTATATPEPTVEPTPVGPDLSRFADVPEIVDPTNYGWPRSVETTKGVITLDAPPEKIHSLSLGHTEILAALMDFERLSAVYSFFVDEEQSNIAGLSADHNMIGFDPEEVVALEPDVIVASRFTNADTVALLNGAGNLVVRTALENSALGNVPNILLIGYLIGAEAEAVALVEDIEARMEVISDLLPGGDKPRVLSISKFTSVFAAGSGSTEGGIIEQAGGINAAADSGIEGHLQVSVESIAAINPDVIIVPQPLEGADLFIEELVSNAALADVPAVKNGEVHYVLPKYHTTLSHWNVRGIEQLAGLLYPEAFAGVTFEDFSSWPDYGVGSE
ncbi:MAG: ABC transporter substrate-binding protein [SAR202 cluster bacterium]|nr:ABC transporter substrate-binding protein [SAR202 cluster bacterium]